MNIKTNQLNFCRRGFRIACFTPSSCFPELTAVIHKVQQQLTCSISQGGGGVSDCQPALVGEQHLPAQARAQRSGLTLFGKLLYMFSQDVEWGFCFDVHLNAFFPILVILHFLQLFVYHTLIGEIGISYKASLQIVHFTSSKSFSESDWFLSTLLGNSMWMVGTFWILCTFNVNY